MVSRSDVRDATYDVTQSALRARFPDMSSWPDGVPLGSSGSGYGLTDRTIIGFVKGIYRGLKTTDQLKPCAADFNLPDDLQDSVDNLLDGDVLNLERWIAANVCDQLKLP